MGASARDVVLVVGVAASILLDTIWVWSQDWLYLRSDGATLASRVGAGQGSHVVIAGRSEV